MKLPTALLVDDAKKIIKSIVDSNRYVIISAHDSDDKKSVTITSIEVRLPQFSIGDTIMIVDTGEIHTLTYNKKSDNIWFLEPLHDRKKPHELVKIDPSLLPLLQD